MRRHKLADPNWRALNYMEWTGQPLGIGDSGGRHRGEVWPVEGGYMNSRTDTVHKSQASAIQDLFPNQWVTNLPEE